MSNLLSITKSAITVGLLSSISFTASAKPNLPTLPLEQLKQFSEVYSRIKKDYVEEVDDKKLITDAIRGMLTGLDPHSAYLDESAYADLRVDTSGEFGGLGIEVGMENGFIKIIAPMDDTPAYRAGLKSGDLIIRINDQSIKGKSLDESVKKMRGKIGEPIDLLIVREGKNSPFNVTIIRAVIKVKSVKSRMLESGFGYIRISNFQATTTTNLKKAIASLIEKNDNENLKGIVLDLRNNPGGLLKGAVGVSDVFLRKGKIVYTEGRVDDALSQYNAKPDDLLEDAPLVVLINQGSASASEIVAGALQDHKRAIIAGIKSFGKGSVQTVLPLGENTGVKLTTARYFTPLGRSIQAKGITPDITIQTLAFKDVDEKKEKEKIAPLSEADLSGHLSNPNGEKKPESKKDKLAEEEEKKEEEKKVLARDDYPLYEALNILKSMSFVKSRR